MSRNLHLVVFAAFLAAPLSAQLVTPKTVPVFQDEQFALFPTSRPGMSGVGIALDDTLGDPFSNPAKAARLRGLTLFTAPYSHSISGNRGGGRTVPAGVMFGSSTWSGVAFGALQEMDRAGPTWNLATSDQTGNNQYYMGTLARSLSNGIALGISAFHADLSVVDGVDLLYQGSDAIKQSGSLSDVRLGATKEWEKGHVLEAVLVRSVTHMRHDVHFTTFTWDRVARVSQSTERTDVNLDETTILGAHTAYVKPVGSEGWRLGGVVTANRLSHPKIPNYVLQNVPRDPGSTNAFNFGVGANKERGPVSLAVELVLEPMSSTTWADMATDFKRTDGSVIPAGQRTMENHFVFRNSRGGISGGRKFGSDSTGDVSFAFNYGLSMHSISYNLTQTNNMTRTVRDQHEHWIEAGPSLGFLMHTKDMDISYAYRSMCGTGDCVSFGDSNEIVYNSPVAETGGIIAAPSSALRLQSGRESSHHFMISVPIR